MRLTASKRDLAELCPYPFRPDVEVPQEAPGDAARLGTAWHDVAATTIIMPAQATGPAQLYDRALKDAGLDPDKWRDRLIAMRPIEIAKELVQAHVTARAEVAYAWHAETGDVEELGVNLGRGYPDILGICGTADVVWTEQTPDGFVLVLADWKTGNPDNVTPASKNGQLRFLAGCASRLCDVDLVRVVLRFISPEGEVTEDSAVFSPLELLEDQEMLGVLWERRLIAEPEPGPHCTGKWCPLRMVCPATQEAVQQAAAIMTLADAPSFPLVLAGPEAIQSPEHAEWVLHRWQALKAFSDHVEKCLKAYVDGHGPIPAGEGKIWGPLDIIKREISCSAAKSQELVELLKAHLPEGEALGLVKAQVSLTALEAAAKRCAPPRKGAQLERTIIDALRGAGMVSETQSTQYRVLNAKKDQVAA